MAARKAVTKKVNQWYMKYAEREMLIDQDDEGLFCQVPSECDESKSYTVRVDESMLVPAAESCECKQYEVHHECKHCTIVNCFYKRIYRSNVEKAQAKAAQVEVVETVVEVAPVERKQVWDKDLCAMIYLDTRELVDPVAHAAAIKAQNEAWAELIELEDQMSIVKKRDMMDAPLTRNSGFNLLAS